MIQARPKYIAWRRFSTRRLSDFLDKKTCWEVLPLRNGLEWFQSQKSATKSSLDTEVSSESWYHLVSMTRHFINSYQIIRVSLLKRKIASPFRRSPLVHCFIFAGERQGTPPWESWHVSLSQDHEPAQTMANTFPKEVILKAKCIFRSFLALRFREI